MSRRLRALGGAWAVVTHRRRVWSWQHGESDRLQRVKSGTLDIVLLSPVMRSAMKDEFTIGSGIRRSPGRRGEARGGVTMPMAGRRCSAAWR